MRADQPHPEVQAILDQMERLDVPDLSTLSVEEARDLFETMASTGRYRDGEVDTEDREIAGPAGPIPVRIYRPDRDGPVPTTVFFHGGGFVVGTLDTHDATCRAIADLTGTVVVSVDYRLAPEHPFPAAVHDAYATTEWAAATATDLGGTDEVIVAGGSAGGTLSAVVSLLARDRGGPEIDYQILFYPATSAGTDWDSLTDPETGRFLSGDEMEWFGEQYLTDPLHGANPYAFPLAACSHENLPPATVVTAGFDPLHDEGVAYADALESAGVPVVHREEGAMVHGFVGMIGHVQRATAVIAAVGTDLERALS
ncbi:Alpha/beta superfamily hydrolase [Halanaeroarchaeum sp. HSR-CO]|uniref:alpha/beta hydrolase n=1 Tax=Halanaeroarchaeum sp. HSR-CO TaxID=2866382 RepID=UPI00217E6C75|nr:alpha/beta hydrolase [Halanaeroarchaeum sp. HSR-CO]UWG48438.1 Alpha/beta superfamily hydrolase [Halanaeroarchaeum sp. HSR-CO]